MHLVYYMRANFKPTVQMFLGQYGGIKGSEGIQKRIHCAHHNTSAAWI